VHVVTGIAGSTVVLGPRNADRYDYYASLDLRASREFALRHGTLSVFGEVTNMLDRSNHCCVDYEFDAEDGGGVTVDKDYRNWLPLVPSLGLLWKF
jgi:hypothetical protein